MPQQFTVEYSRIRVNLINNPSFEDGQVTGSVVGTTASVLTYNSTPSPTTLGSLYLFVSALTNSTANEYATPTNESRVIVGKTYTASVYAQNSTLANRLMRIGLRFYTSAGVFISEQYGSDTNTIGGGSPVRLSATSVAPSNAYYASVAVQYQRSSAGVGVSARLDGFLLEESATVLDYFDGSTVGCRWKGIVSDSYSVGVSADEWLVLDNVQQISASIGRQSLIDNFEPSRMNVSARYPNGFSIGNESLVVDTPMRVKRVGSAYIMWTGRIRNVTVQWAIPYNTATGIGVADTVDIECEGALAQWGRLQGNGLFVAPDDLLTQISNVLSGTNLQYGTTYTAATAPELSASEVSDSLAAWLNTACATVGATIKDGSDSNIVGVNGRDFVGNLPVQFSDTTNNSVSQVYDTITFDSVSADFFTQIELNTYSYGDIEVNYGIAPYRTLRQTTYSASIPQATDLSNYLLGIFGDNGFGISEISCKSEAQNSWALDMGYGWWDIIGYSTFVRFRGLTFRCTIVGAAFTATPSESRFTYYLSDIGLTPFLILDDTTAGILDQNKLGW